MMDKTQQRGWQPIELFLIIGVLASVVVQILVMQYQVYRTIDHIDKVQHLTGGIVVGVFMLYWFRQHDWFAMQAPWWVHWTIVVGVVLLIGVGWEFFEYSWDNWWGHFVSPYADPAQPSLNDTMADIALDIAGGIVGVALFWRRG